MADQNQLDPLDPSRKLAEEDIPEVQNELSKVATNPKQSLVILVVIFIGCLIIFFKFFFNDHTISTTTPPPMPTDITKPAQDSSTNLHEIPKLPEVPKLEAPIELPPPPPLIKTEPLPITPTKESLDVPTPPSSITMPSSGKLIHTEEEKNRTEIKRKSAIMLMQGTPPAKTPEQIAAEASFQDRGDMSLLLAHGKIIEAVLETAISSDFGGEVRAIISRDVFSEQNKNILIPKGSKIFGNYAMGSSGAYGRIAIIWNRIDLSHGYTINLDAVAVDSLGRKGEQGRVDNKIKERLTNAVLLSAFNIGVANALDKVVAPPINSQASATNISIAQNIQATAQSINNGAGTPEDKINRICNDVQNAITDKTSNAFTLISTACTTARSTTGSTIAADRLNNLMTAVTSASTSLLTTAATASTPTQAQTASKEAFTHITDTMKDILGQQDFKPSTTIDQGTIIKIYVNKDYKFPKNLLKKSRLIR
ncbi:TrbI/VirB10 family protein [Candidatus Tisiphia endosymbiont of Nemotelus uliginosus]|uniref:TrbI/VirB10 family protein n=1 Tax=Candidatus Tisiphia endosymbiont of Nemotelus uliginosus TaxID=3077926 RepID=UPI0035C8E17A